MTSIEILKKNGISVVLGSFNRREFLKLTISSIREEFECSDIPYEIIVVDGGSTDGTIKWLIEQKDIITIIQHNRGIWKKKDIPRRSWGYFINLCFRSAHGKYICMLSDDCLVIPNAIINGYRNFEDALTKGEKCGAMPFFWRDWPIMEDYSVHLFYGVTNLNHGLYLRSALEEIGFADEETYQFYCGDVDIMFNLITHNYIIKPSENSFVEHYSHANISNRATNLILIKQDKENFLLKWRKAENYIANVNWDIGEEKIYRTYCDQHHTVKAYYPYCHSYKLSKIVIEFWLWIKQYFGETRISKFDIDSIKGALNESNNVFLKKIEYIFYNTK